MSLKHCCMYSCLSEKIEKYAVILVGLLFLRTWRFSPPALNFLFWVNHNIMWGGSFIVSSFCILNDTCTWMGISAFRIRRGVLLCLYYMYCVLSISLAYISPMVIIWKSNLQCCAKALPIVFLFIFVILLDYYQHVPITLS